MLRVSWGLGSWREVSGCYPVPLSYHRLHEAQSITDPAAMSPLGGQPVLCPLLKIRLKAREVQGLARVPWPLPVLTEGRQCFRHSASLLTCLRQVSDITAPPFVCLFVCGMVYVSQANLGLAL